ncbi:hypothetical protein [Albibacterium bauzanense]|uniref:Uncharacterized protein n=1 Tax=Albibacterium bauzanense TaxID=653929 RepID=A0A4R1M665_9SPHI|nr:hypothetical protein [Albibacterium bauzanense]TCK85233.1 hypothetical protein C8N28_0534 [Albibacterium bauzanense]
MKTPGKTVRADKKSEVFKKKGSNNDSFNDFDDEMELEDFSEFEDLDDFDVEDDDF